MESDLKLMNEISDQANALFLSKVRTTVIVVEVRRKDTDQFVIRRQ